MIQIAFGWFEATLQPGMEWTVEPTPEASAVVGVTEEMAETFRGVLQLLYGEDYEEFEHVPWPHLAAGQAAATAFGGTVTLEIVPETDRREGDDDG